MKKMFWLAVLVLAIAGSAACHHWKSKPEVDVSPRKIVGTLQICQGYWCDFFVTINSDCSMVDSAGKPITEITLTHAGDNICFLNESGCALTLEFPEELFGPTRMKVDLENHECVNLSVLSGAKPTGTDTDELWLFDIYCNCGDMTGEGHTNPGVRVGEDEEDP